MFNPFKRTRKITQIENIPEEIMDKWMDSNAPITFAQARERIDYLIEYHPLNSLPYTIVGIAIEKSRLWEKVNQFYKKPDEKELLQAVKEIAYSIPYVDTLQVEYIDSLPTPLDFFATAETVVSRYSSYVSALFLDTEANDVISILGVDFEINGPINTPSLENFQVSLHEKTEAACKQLGQKPPIILLSRTFDIVTSCQLLTGSLEVYENLQVPVLAAFARDDKAWYSIFDDVAGSTDLM